MTTTANTVSSAASQANFPVESAASAASAAAAVAKQTFDSTIAGNALWSLIAIVAIAGFVLLRLPRTEDIEVQKIRFAATTFTGLLLVYVFAAVLYYVDIRVPNTAGKEIFEKTITAITPLIGAIIGYLFGKQERGPAGSQKKPDDEKQPTEKKT